ncbi:MAG TPA: hypothetical protein VGU68_06555, partial [Ktedonobacteraceae bacterium]|nr:hypothetical protein [Ktedonobacteraceae bacterium]
MDLWTEFDNARPAPDAHGYVQPLRSRRLTERAILTSLREWLLHDYAAAYCRSLAATRIFRRCYWVDGLGMESRAGASGVSGISGVSPGEDRNHNGSERKKTTSVPQALQSIVSLSQLLAREQKPIALHGLLLGTSSKRKEAKTGANAAVAIPKGSGIVKAGWPEAAPALLKEIEQAPAIFLLNPFGPAQLSYEDLASLYQRTVPTELCLLAPHKQLEARLLAARRNPAQAALLTAVLRSDRWKTLPEGEDKLTLALDGLLELFIASMQRHFLLPVQRVTLPMQVRPATVEEVPYTLIFATRRQDSIVSMNDAVCLHRRAIQARSRQGVLGEEWFARQEQLRLSAEVQQLYQRALQQGRAQRARRWPDLRQQLLLAQFGEFTLQEYDAVMQQLFTNSE